MRGPEGDAHQVGTNRDHSTGASNWSEPGFDGYGLIADGHGERGWIDLDGASCAQLIATAAVGRIAFTHRALPVVLPVELQCPPASLRFDVGDGALLQAARHTQVVCFQTDSGEFGAGSWSVAVVGHLSVHAEWRDDAGETAAVIELQPELVTGRQREVPAQ